MEILILYGTLTYNTETVAQSIYDYIFENTEHNVEIMNVIDMIDLNQLNNFDLIIFGTSTWGEGEYPPDSEDFMNSIDNDESIDLSGKKIAFFGLGEIEYEFFCGAIDKAKDSFSSKWDIQTVGEIHKIDGYPDDEKIDEVIKWVQAILDNI